MRTLVLNAGYEPLAVVSFKRAIVLVMNEKATIVASDDEHPVHGADRSWDRPSHCAQDRAPSGPKHDSDPKGAS